MGKKTEKSAIGELLKVKNYTFNVNTLWLYWILKYDEENKEMLSHLIAFLKTLMFSEEEVSNSHVFDSRRYLFFLVSFFLAFLELIFLPTGEKQKIPTGGNEKNIFLKEKKGICVANMFQE